MMGSDLFEADSALLRLKSTRDFLKSSQVEVDRSRYLIQSTKRKELILQKSLEKSRRIIFESCLTLQNHAEDYPKLVPIPPAGSAPDEPSLPLVVEPVTVEPTINLEVTPLDEIADFLLQAYERTEADGDPVTRNLIEKVLRQVGYRLAHRLGPRAAGVALH